MAGNMTFGAILREARERKGLDLPTAARHLRIRADILRAIEENDFSRMPPRGYTRNMVNAYARLVDLNPSDMTRMYLDEANAYQTGRMRTESTRARSSRGRRTSSEETSRSQRRSNRDSSSQRDGGAAGAHRTPLGRTLVDDRNTDRVHPSRHTIVPGSTQYTNLYAAPKNVPQQHSKLPFVIGAIVVLVVVVIVCALVFGNKGSQPAQETPTVPITGLSDTSNKQAESSDSAASSSDTATPPAATSQASAAPTKATFAYKVASGGSVYIEVYEGDSSSATIAQTVTGPSEKSFDVTTKLRFVSDASSSVECTLDGEKVDLTENSNGMYDYTVNFANILAKWQSEHGTSTSGASSASASGSSSATSTQSSTSSTASNSTSTSGN